MPVGRGRGYNGSIPDILALTAWSYRSGLIKAYTLPYLDRIRAQLAPGSRIALVTLEQDGFALDEEARRREQARLASRGVDWIPLPYARFGLRALWNAALGIARLAFLCRRRRIADLHCFGTPAGAQGYALSILTGARLVLDSYEPHAEAMVETGTWKRTSLAFRILFPLERLQSRRARAVIAVSEGMRDYARSRYGVEFSRFFVKPACVDLELFKRDELEAARLRKALGLEGAVACVYAGKTGGI
ncbi:MAG TPA: glycosyltransferase [Elusimicrobiota bacterium]|nr:glycosyltransferase [Elusimicrobiota bacterium]